MNVMSLKSVRQEHGLTQQQLADKSGVNRAVISKYEADMMDPGHMSLMTAKKLCNALHCSPWELWNGPIKPFTHGGRAIGLLAKAKREQQAKQAKKPEEN